MQAPVPKSDRPDLSAQYWIVLCLCETNVFRAACVIFRKRCETRFIVHAATIGETFPGRQTHVSIVAFRRVLEA